MTQRVALIIAAIALSTSVTADSPVLVVKHFSDNTCATTAGENYKVTTEKCHSIAAECEGQNKPFACSIHQDRLPIAKGFRATCNKEGMTLRVFLDEACNEPAPDADFFQFNNTVCLGQIPNGVPIQFECEGLDSSEPSEPSEPSQPSQPSKPGKSSKIARCKAHKSSKGAIIPSY
jgi:hypothetical protein